MSPIQSNHKRYTVLARALNTSKISKVSIESGITKASHPASLMIHNRELVRQAANTPLPPEPSDAPKPPTVLIPLNTTAVNMITQVSPKSPRYDVEATEDIIPCQRSARRRTPTWEPFHGGVALMSLQEKIDALADQVLSDVEEGKCPPRTTQIRRRWWVFGMLGV